MGVKTQWSQDIPVGGDKMKETRLLKVYFICVPEKKHIMIQRRYSDVST